MDKLFSMAKEKLEEHTNKDRNDDDNNNNNSSNNNNNNNNQGSGYGYYKDDQSAGYGSNQGSGYGSNQGSNQGYGITGGSHLNAPHSQNRPDSPDDFDRDDAVRKASQNGSGDSSLFSQALSFLDGHKSDRNKPVDEDEATRAHDKAYREGKPEQLNASSLGSAAALQILKQFTGGSSSGSGQKEKKTDLISLAMAEATKLFDKSGGAASGNKQDAVNGAAMTVMKLMVQSKFSGGGSTGGSDSGGLGQLAGLASQFLKK